MSNFLDEILGVVNEARITHDLRELSSLDNENINNSYYSEIRISITEELLQTGKSPIECCINELNFILTSDDDNKKVLLSSVATHVAVTVDEFDDQNIDVSIKILNKYLELEPVGPFIAGDLVLQGYSLEPNYAPAVCKIEFLSNSDETGDYQELSTIMPWEMIYQPGDNEGNPDSFAIPITLPSDNLEGTAHLTVYVDIASNTPHNEPSSSYLPDNPQLIAAIDFFTPVSSHPQDMTPRPVEEEKMSANQRSYQVITSIKSSSYHQSEALLHGNYLTPCPCIDMINGFQQTPDEEHDWKFVIAIEQNDENTHLHGLEDAMFVVRDKDTGDFDLPEGYELDSSNLLADIPNMDTPVHLAYRMGSSALFSSIYLLSSDEESDEMAEAVFQAYVDKYLGGGAEIRVAPSIMSQVHGYRVGLLLVYKGNDVAEAFFRNGAIATRQEPAPPLQKGIHQYHHNPPEKEEDSPNDRDHGIEEDEVSHMTGDDDLQSPDGGSDDDDDAEDDQFHLDEEAIAQLTKKYNDLEAEKERALVLNMELQKKCSSILARIGRDTQSRNGPAGNDPDNELTNMNSMDNNNAEKENHFAETLTSISEGRSKLLKQQTEYEQLAFDLQSRLDEKEYKAEEISESLNEFKREILSKAENSRTAQGLSKRVIKQFEYNEKKKDNELEKVRLRNISLKTTLKRLEKTLRGREQLAEGLHMIDFEQLKIENQTLSEKIEERNEELSKLKRKKTTTVQILTHIREKLRYIENQNILTSQELISLDRDIISTRNNVTIAKHNREIFRENNVELKRQRGFATSDLLIIDYETRKHTIEMLQQNIKELQERHFLLTKQITTNKLKLTQSSVGRSGTYGLKTMGSGNEGYYGSTGGSSSGGGERIALPPIGKEGRKNMTGSYKGKLRK